MWPMGLLFLKTSPVKQYSYENIFSGVFDALHQTFLVVVCSSLYLYEIHWMHSPGHPDLSLNVGWQMYLNKTIYNFIEYNETRLCSNDLHPRALLIWVTLLYDEY